jgi:hypothetical protein
MYTCATVDFTTNTCTNWVQTAPSIFELTVEQAQPIVGQMLILFGTIACLKLIYIIAKKGR